MNGPVTQPGTTAAERTGAGMKWWGWGSEAKRASLGGDARAMLRSELGQAEPADRVGLEQVAMPESRPLPPEIAEAVGEAAVLHGSEDRLRRAAGRGYHDLVRLRSGRLEQAPDAVVLPADDAQVARVLEVCAREGVAVVPFGGGTSVVGGVEPLAGRFERLISLDLRRLRKVSVDLRSMTATLGPGLRGPEAEKALRGQGVTLGHFPQSFECATIGGFAATRSAGQASSGYGRFDELVTSVELTAPTGSLRTVETPHSAAGPALRELVVGSEGVLGAITRVTARVRAAPERRRYEAWMAPDFGSGAEIVRSLAQADALPDVVRLSDQAETRVSMGLSGASGIQRSLLSGYLRLRRRAEGCLVVCGWEGEAEAVERRRALSGRLLRSGDAAGLGAAPGARGNGAGTKAHIFATSSSTWATWWRRSRPPTPGAASLGFTRPCGGRSAPRSRTRARRGSSCAISPMPTATAHLSTSPSWPARRPGAELEQWRAVKTAACEAIVGEGGRSPTITPWAWTTSRTCGPRSASWGSRPYARSRSASTRRGS